MDPDDFQYDDGVVVCKMVLSYVEFILFVLILVCVTFCYFVVSL